MQDWSLKKKIIKDFFVYSLLFTCTFLIIKYLDYNCSLFCREKYMYLTKSSNQTYPRPKSTRQQQKASSRVRLFKSFMIYYLFSYRLGCHWLKYLNTSTILFVVSRRWRSQGWRGGSGVRLKATANSRRRWPSLPSPQKSILRCTKATKTNSCDFPSYRSLFLRLKNKLSQYRYLFLRLKNK